MVKKLDKLKTAKPVDKQGRIEKEKGKPGRKPLKSVMMSPRGESIENSNIRELQTVEKRANGHQAGYNSRDQPSLSEKEKSSKLNTRLEIMAKEVTKDGTTLRSTLEKRLDNLNDTILELKEVTLNKIDDLKYQIKSIAHNRNAIELTPSSFEVIRKIMAEEISRELKNQLSEIVSHKKLRKKNVDRFNRKKIFLHDMKATNPVRTRKLIGKTFEKMAKPLRVRRERGQDDVVTAQPVKSTIFEQPLLNIPQMDYPIISLLTARDDTEQQDTKKDVTEPSNAQMTDSDREPSQKQSTDDNKTHPGSYGLLPSALYKPIEIIVEDHQSKITDINKSIPPDSPLFKPTTPSRDHKDDFKSANTDVEGGYNSTADQEMDIDFDFNAFSLNN